MRRAAPVSTFVRVIRVHRQIHGTACIAAAATTLLEARGLVPPPQGRLDDLVQAGMRAGESGFAALAEALRVLHVGCTATRRTPTAGELVRWIEETPAAAEGFLVSHHVPLPGGREGAHITVVLRAGDAWYRADPADSSVRPVALEELVPRYAGDVALLTRDR